MTIDADVTSAALPTDVLADYDPASSFVFLSPRRRLLAAGSVAEVPATGPPDELSDRAAATLRAAEDAGHPRPLIVGAVPFTGGTPARLWVPASTRWSGPAATSDDRGAARAASNRIRDVAFRFQPEFDQADYLRGVERALRRIADGALRKVVLARSVRAQASIPVDPGGILRSLTDGDPGAYVFALNLRPHAAQPRVLVGASPELLVARAGGGVLARPLAGSSRRSPDPAEDRRVAQRLLASAKDLHEHAMVVDVVAAGLRRYCRDLDVPAEPVLLHTATMWHLCTPIAGRLADPEVSSLTLATALHPTPAICGTPVAAARTEIAATEPFDRGYYGGMTGWCDAAGDGEWAVTIRCAEVEGASMRLFAGSGIVAGSRPEAEFAETSAKLRTLLLAMGIDQTL